MGTREKHLYLERIRSRYRKANKAKKSQILDEFCAVCSYNRKYAVRLLAPKKPGRPKKSARGRPPIYADKALVHVVRRIWLAADLPCGKRLKAMLPLWLPHDHRRYGPHAPELLEKLARISAASLDRMLTDERLKRTGKGLSGTKPGSLLRQQIPLRVGGWDEQLPGFLEADTVAHCGTSMAGSFVWSLTLTDIHTTWTECRAVWNKGSHGIVAAIKEIEKILPFPLRGFDCDNGSEFLNHHLVRYFQKHKRRPVFTRSRPYRKNDNAHVEQKNWSHVRQLLGYDRFDDPELVPLLNQLYANEFSLLRNYFSPSVKLLHKTRDGSRIVRKHSLPKTPFQRVLQSDHIDEAEKKRLIMIFENLDPFELSRSIQKQLRTINKLAKGHPSPRTRI